MKSYGATEPAGGRNESSSGSPHSDELNENADADPRPITNGQKLKQFYERNFGLLLVFLAQTCGSIVCSKSWISICVPI